MIEQYAKRLGLNFGQMNHLMELIDVAETAGEASLSCNEQEYAACSQKEDETTDAVERYAKQIGVRLVWTGLRPVLHRNNESLIT